MSDDVINIEVVDGLEEAPADGSAYGREDGVWVGVLRSEPAGIEGASQIFNVVSMSQASYDELAVKDPNTLYVIT